MLFCTLSGEGGSLKAQPSRLLLNQCIPYRHQAVNKAVHNTQVLNSQCQEDITRNKVWLTEYHYYTGTTTVASKKSLKISKK